jgi:signal transduction histidine kinase
VSLLVAAVAMVLLLQRSLRDGVRTAALARAEAIAVELASGSGSALVASGDVEEEFVQVLDARGDVVLASPNLDGAPPLVRLAPGGTRTLEEVPFEDGPFLVVATAGTLGADPVTVIVGRDVEDVGEVIATVTRLLAIGIPLLLVLVGLVTWRVVGRALAPVERIRAEVDAISTEELHRRVPEPAGEDEISRLAATMNRMLARLEDGQTRQRRFVSDASHELRSPLASIRQHAEVAQTHPGTTSQGELADVVLLESARLQSIVEDLLILSRADEGTLRLTSEPVDLDDVVLEEAARLRGAGTFRIDTAAVSAGRVLGDRAALERLLRNLTDNAARHARSSIALSLRGSDGEVVMAVDDDGNGIAEGHRALVFDRFMRLEDARDRDSGGSGLGLAIVREIAVLHHGSVEVSESSLGGARLEVRIPSLAD